MSINSVADHAIQIAHLSKTIKSSTLLCEFYAKLRVILFHALANCIKLKQKDEISLTKAIIEFKNQSRELFLLLNTLIYKIKIFIEKLIMAWSKFSIKDTHRKKRISTLSTHLS